MIPYDPDKARQLLTDAGLGSGASMSIDAQILIAPHLKPVLEATIGLWGDVGVDTDVRTIEVNVWRDRLYGRATEGRPGAFLMGWSSFLYEAALALQWHVSTNPYDLWANPKFDELFAAVNREVDGETRNQLYRELMQEERIESGGALGAGAVGVHRREPGHLRLPQRPHRPGALHPVDDSVGAVREFRPGLTAERDVRCEGARRTGPPLCLPAGPPAPSPLAASPGWRCVAPTLPARVPRVARRMEVRECGAPHAGGADTISGSARRVNRGGRVVEAAGAGGL